MGTSDTPKFLENIVKDEQADISLQTAQKDRRRLEDIITDAAVAIKAGFELPSYIKDAIVEEAIRAAKRQRDLTPEEDRLEQGLSAQMEESEPLGKFLIVDPTK